VTIHPDVLHLRSPATIRERAKILFDRAVRGESQFYRINSGQLERCVDFVLETTRKAYPDLKIPYHSRWRHFDVGGIDRASEILRGLHPMEKARTSYDLVITSVLLDAGAGPSWKFRERIGTSEHTWTRSEGLAVASVALFRTGVMSSDKSQPLRADALALRALSSDSVAKTFQVSAENPLVGVDGRTALLRNLGEAVAARPDLFPGGRPGGLVDVLVDKAGTKKSLAATDILLAVLDGMGPIWPSRLSLHGCPLGDVWEHPGLPAEGRGGPLMPFHKLSQWLTYSLIEPLEELGLTVTGIDHLTGLPEYRNGGLFVDFGVMTSQTPDFWAIKRKVSDPAIVELRALTVHLLDLTGQMARTKLGKSSAEMPLAKILQGGTWTAGRHVAASKRAGGGPPFEIDSDGTVF
jgi:hypothetical protein